MFHQLLYHTNRDQIMNLLRLGFLHLVCAAMLQLTASQTTTEGVAAVDLGTAGSFAILTKTGVTTTGITSVDGHMGTSPIAQTALTGFALTLHGDYSTSPIVTTGKVYAADHAVPTPTMMTTSINDMETAYTDAAGRASPFATTVGCGAGDISGMTLTSGIYKWSTDVKFDNTLTFNGTPTDVWIMQTLRGSHPCRRCADAVAFDDGSHGEGIFLAKTMISFNAGSSLNGAAFAQTAVTMISTGTLIPSPLMN